MRRSKAFTLLLVLAGCSGDKRAAPKAAPPKPAAEVTPSEKTLPVTGRIEGIVILATDAELPGLAADPKAGGKFALIDPPAPCTQISADDRHPVKRDPVGGGLSFVHVAITGMANSASAAAPVTHELRLENCRLERPLLAVRAGDKVRLTNHSRVPLFPGKVGGTVMEALLAGTSRTIEMPSAGATRLACGFGSYCGQTDVLITSHPLFAVTDGSGRFRIDGVPLDSTLTVHAWHPLFQESHSAFTLSQAERTATLSLTLQPAQARVKPGRAPTKKRGQAVVH